MRIEGWLAAIALCLFSAAAHAQSWAIGRSFVCEVRQVQRLSDDGMLGSNEATAALLRGHRQFTFDEARGTLRWQGSQNSWQFELMDQPTGEGNNLEAVRIYRGPTQVVIETLRIATWRDNWPFVYDVDGDIYTGVCRQG